MQHTTIARKKHKEQTQIEKLFPAYQTSSRNSLSVNFCKGRSSCGSSRHIIAVSFKLLLEFIVKQFFAGLIDAPGSHWPPGYDNWLSPGELSCKMHLGGTENDISISSNTVLQ